MLITIITSHNILVQLTTRFVQYIDNNNMPFTSELYIYQNVQKLLYILKHITNCTILEFLRNIYIY